MPTDNGEREAQQRGACGNEWEGLVCERPVGHAREHKAFFTVDGHGYWAQWERKSGWFLRQIEKLIAWRKARTK